MGYVMANRRKRPIWNNPEVKKGDTVIVLC